jgi:hypothetical protein
MGIRLMAEVMDRAPATLTQREHKVLIILAEDAIDGEPGERDGRGREKRVTRQPPDSPIMLRRARVSRSQLYAIIAALMAKGCLQRVTAGGGGHPARYRIPALCVPENRTQAPGDNPESCVPETGTQPGSVSQKPGPAVSRFAKDTDRPRDCYSTPNGARPSAEVIAPELAEQVRDRNGAAPPQSLRDHDGPENDGSDDQRPSVPVIHQSQAADRNAREEDQGYRLFKAARARGEIP